jgi:hypothetical protein
MERMQAEARQAGAGDVVSLQIIEGNHVWGHHAIGFLAVGTAINRFADRGSGPARPRPRQRDRRDTPGRRLSSRRLADSRHPGAPDLPNPLMSVPAHRAGPPPN